jgi:hypothetical protein
MIETEASLGEQNPEKFHEGADVGTVATQAVT